MTVHEVDVVLGMGPGGRMPRSGSPWPACRCRAWRPAWPVASAPTGNACPTFHRAMEPALQDLAPAELPPLKLR
jgi:hypothetical protein